jgi:dolichol-phosphate mannosyltransferase
MTAMTNEHKPFRLSGYLLIAAGVVLIRLIFSGLLDLFPEEAYYWNYAQHLDIGYLDHPPIVAWLIWLSTSLGGQAEFFVRLPAFLCWIVFVVFMVRFARRSMGDSAASPTILLAAMLPIYFSLGFLMTPDAPLYACWAGALYFLYEALVQKRGRAWLWVGVSVGLGLMSKYTMGLVVGSAFVYMIIDADSRRWFRRPEPYLAALIAALIFLPVIIWNFHNDWASFAFQGSRRWSGTIRFSLHEMLGAAVILLTPIGFLAAMEALFKSKQIGVASPETESAVRRTRWFMLTFTLAPLSIFVLNGLRSQAKLNWTGPVWLGILPLMAYQFAAHRDHIRSRFGRFIRGGWKPTVITLAIIYPLCFLYIFMATPGFVPAHGLPLPTAWPEFTSDVYQIRDSLQNVEGKKPLMVGLHHYWIESEMSYYGLRRTGSLPEVGGSYFVDGGSLMWDRWTPPAKELGRNILLVGFRESSLEPTWVTKHFDTLLTIRRVPIKKYGRTVGHFFWRFGYDYRWPPDSMNSQTTHHTIPDGRIGN